MYIEYLIGKLLLQRAVDPKKNVSGNKCTILSNV